MLSRLFGRGEATSPNTISYDALCAALAGKECTLVDVREPHEYAAGHVAGSHNMPLSQFDPSRLPHGKVVLICQAGARSARALAQTHASGRKDVVHYAGGASGWRAAGGPLHR